MEAKEPWDIKNEDSREADGLKTFIIYCEDENSEPLYFRSLASGSVKVNAIPNQKSGKLNLINAINDCVKEERVMFSDNKYRIVEELVELVWCVYDRDIENNNFTLVDQKNHLAFNLAIQTALDAGLNIAWSNDAFELWVLLHFEDVPPVEKLHREYFYERLTSIFKTILPRSKELDDITGKPNFNYKTSFKRKDYFIKFVLPHLKNGMAAAVERAKCLEDHFADQALPFHERNPSTLVHHLVEAITKP